MKREKIGVTICKYEKTLTFDTNMKTQKTSDMLGILKGRENEKNFFNMETQKISDILEVPKVSCRVLTFVSEYAILEITRGKQNEN